MNKDRRGMSTAGAACIITRIIVCGLGNYQCALGTNWSLFILQTDSTSGTVKVEGPDIFVPLDVGRWTGEQLDGACEGDGAARLDKYRGLCMYDSSGS